MTDFLEISSGLRSLATDLIKIGHDLILLCSGPRTGLNEIRLPAVVKGSSIMSGKINPSMVEMVHMVCFQVIGNDTTIQHAAASGTLELNINGPVIAHNLLESLNILSNAMREFANRCVKGIKANKDVLQRNFEMTPSAGIVLNPLIGYDKTAELIKEAVRKKKTVRELAVEKGIITEKEAKKLFSAKNLL